MTDKAKPPAGLEVGSKLEPTKDEELETAKAKNTTPDHLEQGS